MIRAFALAVLVVALACGVRLSPAVADAAASRIVDRTFSCEAGFVGGLHQIRIYSAYRADPGSSELRASSSVTQNRFESLGSMSSDGFTVHRGHCVSSKATVKLTTKDLRGGVVPPLGAEVTCETPRRVLLRVRAVFERPVTTRITRRFGFPQLVASGDLEQAAVAVGTLTGKTVAYMSLTGAEKARLFTVRTCEED